MKIKKHTNSGGLYEYDFTIITLCYKGAKYISRLYENILSESGSFAVQWVIIDDYSDDDGESRSAILAQIRKGKIDVVPVFLSKNYGGSLSISEGAKIAKAPYCLILDQDDLLAKNALSVCASVIEKYSNFAGFAGLCGRCIGPTGKLIGSQLGDYEIYASEAEIRHEYKLRGEMFQCSKTSVLRDYFLYQRPGFTNGYIWNKVAKDHKYLYTSKILRIYDTGNPDSFSNSKKIRFHDEQREQIAEYLSSNINLLLRHDFGFLVSQCLHFGRLSCHVRNLKFYKALPRSARLVSLIVFPLAVIRAFKDKVDGRF